MITKNMIINKVDYIQKVNKNNVPIYEILMFEHPDKELIYPSGKHSGFPDMGATSTSGFYYDINDAIQAVEEDRCGLRETIYDAAFILCRFCGLFQTVSSEFRMYFIWDADKEGYIQKEEPIIFKHIAL